MIFLGIDTSNYTTSCAVYDSDNNSVIQQKMLLPVKAGEKGIRQSDAVFHHTRQLSVVLKNMFSRFTGKIDAIGVSARPRDVEGSYMPCFTVGLNTALSISAVTGIPCFEFSHQSGHVAAALYSAGKLSLLEREFIAFHISGGTTEGLLVKPDNDSVIKEKILCSTEDINCGQAVDRCGVMLGLKFPCGRELEELSQKSAKEYDPKIKLKNGNCCLSGVENQCMKMFSDGIEPCDIAAYCLDYVKATVDKMTEFCIDTAGSLPVLYAGGVMSNKRITSYLSKKYNAFVASPDFSSDNAAGVAVLASLKVKSNA